MPDMRLSLFVDVISDAFVISIVAFATSISIADLYARKHKYTINSNKELFALGMCNMVGSFFKCFTAGGTLARTVVQEESGGKTQVQQFSSSFLNNFLISVYKMSLEF